MSNNSAAWKKMLEVRARLAEIENANGGRLRPEDVLKDAADPDSPLHDRFQWDNEKAAHAYRLEQARQLIRSVTITVSNEVKSVRTVCYTRDPDCEATEQGYVSVAVLQSDEDLARRALCDEFRRVGDLLARARKLAEAVGMAGQVEELIGAVVGMRNSLTQEQPTQQQ